MTEGSAGVGSASRGDKATVAVPEALGPGVYDGAGGGAGAKGHRIARPGTGPMHRGERASERLLSQKERDIARGTDELGPTEGGSPRDPSGHGKNMTEWGVLTSGDRSGRDVSGLAKKVTSRGTSTSRNPEREGPARKGGRCDRVKGTHLWGLREEEDASGHAKKVSERYSRAVRVVVKPGTVASMKSGLLGCSRTCSRWPSIVVVGSGVREEWSRRC